MVIRPGNLPGYPVKQMLPLKKILSYLFPVRLTKTTSTISGPLEVNLVNGRKMLDTLTSNYSYGSLQRILHKGLLEIGFNQEVRKVLVLGLGGGSVVQTIRESFHSSAFIELIDIDPEIISLAIHEFDINRFGNVRIVQADAAEFVESCGATYDLILVDVFVINRVPEVFTKPKFINQLVTCLQPNGKIIYNTMRETMTRELFNQLKNEFLAHGLKVNVLEQVEQTNDLILVEK
jgi:spermidine synthase